MKVIGPLTLSEIISDHFGYDDYQGRWWDIWSVKRDDYTAVVANPGSPGNGAWDWMTIGLLTDEEDDE
jgi:hypothetical protein